MLLHTEYSAAGGLLIVWILYSLFRWGKDDEMTPRWTLEDASRAAFGAGVTSASSSIPLTQNREAATYMRFVYSDRIYAGNLPWFRLGTALLLIIFGYWSIAENLVFLWLGIPRMPVLSGELLLITFIIDTLLLSWIAALRRHATGYWTISGCRNWYLSQMNCTIQGDVPSAPFWFLDGSSFRLRKSLVTLAKIVFPIAVAAITISLVATGHHMSLLELANIFLLTLFATFLWLYFPLSLIKVAPWCGYGATKPSFSVAILQEDWENLRR